jgi:hypothetical protein
MADSEYTASRYLEKISQSLQMACNVS